MICGRALSIFSVALFVSGCTSYVTPPANPSQPTPVYLTDYGRHSSILFPDGSGTFTEYAFGDWNWFAANDTSASGALRAMFFSAGSTLGRRSLELPDDIDRVRKITTARRVMRLLASRQRIDDLAQRLDSEYTRRIETIHFNPISKLNFVRSSERYWVFHNCNHVTARWLRQLGFKVSGLSATSNFQLIRIPVNSRA